MNREQAIIAFCTEYCRKYGLVIPVRAVRTVIENKLIETHNAFYLTGSNLRLNK